MFQTPSPDTLPLAPQQPAAVPDSVSTVATTFAERLEYSFALLGEFVPALAGALAILFAGYLVAKVVEKGTARLLRRLHFNQLLERGGVMQAVERSGSHLNPAKVIANVLFWFIMFAVLLVAANAIGMESLANVFSELVSYIPSVIAAIVIIILGIVLGGFVGGLIMASAGGLHGGPWLARIGRGGVIVLAIFMALQELGIATDIVTTAFAILFGAVALALALSFGLGNRELAAEVTREWYGRYRAERAAIEAEAAAEEAEELAEEAAEAAEDEEAIEVKAREKQAEAAARSARASGTATVMLVGALVGSALPWQSVSAQAKQGSAVPARSSAPSSASQSDPETRRFLEADEQFFLARLRRQRGELLAKASWAEMGDRCDPGALRVFPKDTTADQRDSLQKFVDRMEQTLIARAVGNPLTTPEARALIRTIVAWEAGIDRPNWDTDERTPRRAFAAGLTGEVPDPAGPGCLPSPLVSDTVTVVIPGVSDMDFPGAPRPRIKAFLGKDAVQRARDEFVAGRARVEPTADLNYILMAPVLVWREWALVTVRRPKERGGVDLSRPGNGGATYMMRRVPAGNGAEWRLFSVVRSWGD